MKGLYVLDSVLAMLFFLGGNCLATDSLQLATPRDSAIPTSASANGDSTLPIISPDGRFVLFASSADNLLVLTNGNPMTTTFPHRVNVFLRDRTNSTTTLVSVSLAGTGGGNGDSLPSGLSADGRYALFESSANNLVPYDTNTASDVFVRDMVTGITTPVSVSTNGGLGTGDSWGAVLTPDGRYVAFVTTAYNLVIGKR